MLQQGNIFINTSNFDFLNIFTTKNLSIPLILNQIFNAYIFVKSFKTSML